MSTYKFLSSLTRYQKFWPTTFIYPRKKLVLVFPNHISYNNFLNIYGAWIVNPFYCIL